MGASAEVAGPWQWLSRELRPQKQQMDTESFSDQGRTCTVKVFSV